MSLTTCPLVSLLFDGATLSEHDELSVGAGRLGQPVWSPAALLADLELRLGLPSARVGEGVRVQRWSQRLEAVQASGPRFYTESYRVDPLGTATALLAMRDELVASGWNGEAIAGGGARLETLCEVERGADLPPGGPDRLLRVENELARLRGRLYSEIGLAEPRDVWPRRWQRVFGLLADAGVPVRVATVALDGHADAQSDLGRAQSVLRGGARAPSSGLRGDGSLVFLRGETAGELAHALASLLRSWNEPSVAILRGGEARVLDDALVGQGLASTGVASSSRWRPAAQVLPLALELAFEPRDPYRVLELLTLPVGPFEGVVGRELASALAESPGIGGPAWQGAKERIAAQRAGGAADPLERVAEWLEGPAHERTAPRGALQEIADRVGGWVKGKLAFERGRGGRSIRSEVLGAASAQVEAFREALANDPRAGLDLVAVRQLVEQVAGAGTPFETAVERAGRVPPVDSPAGLRVARDVVVWWHCVSGTEWRPSVRPWRRAEIDALRAAGIHLPDAAARLGVEASAWRQVVLAARERLVLAVPRWSAGAPVEPHPIWDEIVARVGAREADVARVTVEARALAEGQAGPHRVAVEELGALALPGARAAWEIRGGGLGPASIHSASSLEALVGCPLKWVLRHRAGLREGSLVSIPRGARLNGTLGHRLVEVLHEAGILLDPVQREAQIEAHLERLLREEAAVLLRPGMAIELAQLRRQLTAAVHSLAEVLVASGLVVRDVEVSVSVPWRGGELQGRLDLLLADPRGVEAVLDLKWGQSTYEGLLRGGRAIQLAVYAAARQMATGAKEMPRAAYFTLSRGEVLAIDDEPFEGALVVGGPPLGETWAKLRRTVEAVERSLREGRVHVTGVARSLPLLEAMAIPEAERAGYLEPVGTDACKYCGFGPLCGKSWEEMA